MEEVLSHEEISKKGGDTTKEKYGPEYYRKIGKKGHAKLLEKYGPEYFTKILPGKAREARKNRKK